MDEGNYIAEPVEGDAEGSLYWLERLDLRAHIRLPAIIMFIYIQAVQYSSKQIIKLIRMKAS